MSSPLLEKLLQDIKSAMKSRDTERLTALRSLHAQVKDATVNVGREVSDETVATVVARAIKQRQDAVQPYRDGGREELAAREEREAEWLRAYQPTQLSEAEIEELVRNIVSETGVSGKQGVGKVMKTLMPQVRGKADGQLVNQVVQRVLSGA